MNTETETQFNPDAFSKNVALKTYIESRQKSPLIAFVLAFFFGAFGLFYTGVFVPLMLLLTSLIFVLAGVNFMVLFVWIFAMIYGPLSVKKYNQNVEAEAHLMSLR